MWIRDDLERFGLFPALSVSVGATFSTGAGLKPGTYREWVECCGGRALAGGGEGFWFADEGAVAWVGVAGEDGVEDEGGEGRGAGWGLGWGDVAGLGVASGDGCGLD